MSDIFPYYYIVFNSLFIEKETMKVPVFTRRSHAGLFFFVTADDPFVLASVVLFVVEGFTIRLGIVTDVFDVDGNGRRIVLVDLVARDRDVDDDDDDIVAFVLAVLLLFNEFVARLDVETGVFDVEVKGRRILLVE